MTTNELELFQETFTLVKMSSRRLDQDEYVCLSHVFKTSGSCFADIFKTSGVKVLKPSSRHLKGVLRTYSRRL